MMQRFRFEEHIVSVIRKNMMRFTYIFSFFILLCSCGRENLDITTTEEEIPTSVELEEISFQGTISNYAGQLQEDVLISIVKNGEVIQSTLSNDNGDFIIENIFDPEPNYIVVVEKESFLVYFENLTEFEDFDINHDITILHETEIGTESPTGSLEGASTIKITGQINHYNTGLLKANAEDNSWLNYSFTEEDGEFEILIEKGSKFKLSALDVCGNSIFDSNISFGPFNQDENVGTFDSSINDNLQTISGVILDCDGNFIQEAFVSIFNPNSNLEDPFKVIYVEGGQFDIDVANCGFDDFVFLEVSDANSGINDLNFFPLTSDIGSQEDVEFFICNANKDVYFDLEIDGTEHGLDFCFIDSGSFSETWSITSDWGFNQVYFELDGFDLGTHNVNYVSIAINPSLIYYGSDADIIVELEDKVITEFDFIINGTIEGSFYDLNSDSIINISGSFSLPLW